jgi:hypothetical protein
MTTSDISMLGSASPCQMCVFKCNAVGIDHKMAKQAITIARLRLKDGHADVAQPYASQSETAETALQTREKRIRQSAELRSTPLTTRSMRP